MSYPVDVTIYLESMKPAIQAEEFKELIFDEYGIEDFEMFLGLMDYELELASLENFNQTHDPMISRHQFIECLSKSVAQYHIDVLKDAGLVEAIIDDEDGQIKYQLTDKLITESEIIKASCN